jgi:hypothetical protein
MNKVKTDREQELEARYKALQSIDVSKLTESRSNFTYLSWSTAWNLFRQECPDAKYEVEKNPVTGAPYFSDPIFGVMVRTTMTVGDETHEMWLSVMDGANRALKEAAYDYEAWEYVDNKKTGSKITKTVPAATMTDINKATMRCLVKNMAIFGLGLDIYCKGDLPDDVDGFKPETPEQKKAKQKAVRDARILTRLQDGACDDWKLVKWPWPGEHNEKTLLAVATELDSDSISKAKKHVEGLTKFHQQANVVRQLEAALDEAVGLSEKP